MDLSIITVTWNSEKYIADQIRSVVLAAENLDYEQIIVDNNSSDKTIELVEKKFPNTKLIKNKKNFGFAKANNQAYKIAKGEFVLFLNPDMKAEEGTIQKMINWMKENKDVGILSPKLLDENKKLDPTATPRRFPTLFDQLLIFFKIPRWFPKILDKYLGRDLDLEQVQIVDSVQGAFMLVKKELLDQIGFAFDERYFIWFEDVDLCREIKKLGYKVVYNPTWSATNFGGKSFAKRNLFWKQIRFFRSALTYFVKWGLK